MITLLPQGRSFLKMHGLGNDFVVLDARTRPLVLTEAVVQAIADRRTGVGFDQLVVLEPAKDGLADVFMRIYNADGSTVGACGNVTRCVAALLMAETGRSQAVIETVAGLLDAQAAEGGMIAVDMGPARLDWREIPLAEAVDTNHLPLTLGGLADPVGVGMGNPHAVFFVPDAEAALVAEIGPQVEHHPLFPERTNVEFAQILSPERIRMRVWERGAGITMACGTGACATLVAAARRGLTGRAAEVVLDGGSLFIEWLKDDHVLMTGPATLAYGGTLDAALLP
jgi:diaminopimelate epimerase